jgi:hypothetical protein
MRATMQNSIETLAAIKQEILKVIPPPEGVAVLRAAARELAAEGRSIPSGRIRELAGSVGVGEEAVDQLWDAFTTDEQDRVTGVAGLTVEQSPHRFQVEDRLLYTWCALDALVFPPFLRRDAKVMSRCPVTEERISLQVGPYELGEADPATTVVGLVTPQEHRRVESAAESANSLCPMSNFYASEEEASRRAHADVTEVFTLPSAYAFGRDLVEAATRR